MICKKRNCESTEFKYQPVTFTNGTKHFERICKKCGGHNYYASQREVENAMGLRRKKKKKPEANKETKESRILWNDLLSKIFTEGGQKMVDDFIWEVDEMFRYEKK